jgi:hypothetical protein
LLPVEEEVDLVIEYPVAVELVVSSICHLLRQ